MRRFLLPLGVALFCLLPALASNPGEPLDCSDWVFLEPGLSCSVSVPLPCANSRFCHGIQEEVAADNEGGLLRIEQEVLGDVFCPGMTYAVASYRVKIVRRSAGITETLAYIESRCGQPGALDRVTHSQYEGLLFDDKLGRLYVPLQVNCTPDDGTCVYQVPGGETQGGAWLAAIDGFTTTFEIFQTYTPTVNTISYRVPYMPEGFPAASYFDTYYGDLATAGNWSKAQPLQCGYPASPPHVGDYLTVTDPLPDPPLNHGRYYVTAVYYMGQTRYGRKSSGGVLMGRDPAALPACSN